MLGYLNLTLWDGYHYKTFAAAPLQTGYIPHPQFHWDLWCRYRKSRQWQDPSCGLKVASLQHPWYSFTAQAGTLNQGSMPCVLYALAPGLLSVPGKVTKAGLAIRHTHLFLLSHHGWALGSTRQSSWLISTPTPGQCWFQFTNVVKPPEAPHSQQAILISLWMRTLRLKRMTLSISSLMPTHP